jgi:hypothetical protein
MRPKRDATACTHWTGAAEEDADHGDKQRLWDVGYAMSPPNDYPRLNQGRH